MLAVSQTPCWNLISSNPHNHFAQLSYLQRPTEEEARLLMAYVVKWRSGDFNPSLSDIVCQYEWDLLPLWSIWVPFLELVCNGWPPSNGNNNAVFTEPVPVLSTSYKSTLQLLITPLWDWFYLSPLYGWGKWGTIYMIPESLLLTTTNSASLTTTRNFGEHTLYHAGYLPPQGKLWEDTTNLSEKFKVMLQSIYFTVFCKPSSFFYKYYYCKDNWKY